MKVEFFLVRLHPIEKFSVPRPQLGVAVLHSLDQQQPHEFEINIKIKIVI